MALNADEVYRVVTNIPNGFDATDMRNYFSFLTEKCSFNYFHFGRKPETHLMGSILKIQACVTQTMMDKGFELSERNPGKYFIPAEDVFHSAEGSENGDEKSLPPTTKTESATNGVTKSIEKMQISGNKSVNGYGTKEKISEDDDLTERISSLANDIETSVLREEDTSSPDSTEDKKKEEYIISKDRFCCVVKIKKEFDEMFKKYFHQKFWVNVAGNVLPNRCLILDFEPIQIVLDYIPNGEDSPMKNRTREQIYQEALHYTECQMNQMQFFKSNDTTLPHGNIGEPTQSIEKMLKDYDLNPDKKMVADLGIKFDVNPNVRRFFKVPFYYHPSSDDQEDAEVMTKNFQRAFTSNGDVISAHQDFRQINRVDETGSNDYQIDYLRNVEYDASAMDWHTYDEFHDAIQEKEKTREAQFTQDIRLPVTEEGSGVVQYFDGQFWCQNEGGEEVRALDGWEVNSEINRDLRKRISPEERKTCIKAWNEKHGKEWAGLPKSNDDEKISEKKLAERKYNYSINALAPYYVKYHIVGTMLLGKLRDPTMFNFPRSLAKPSEVNRKEVWNKHFETSWNELFSEINMVRKRFNDQRKAERKSQEKTGDNKNKSGSKKRSGKRGGKQRVKGPAVTASKRGVNQNIMDRVQRRFDREARAHPEWYGRNMYTPFSSKGPLLQQYGGNSGRYNSFDTGNGYGGNYGGARSAFDRPCDYYNKPSYSSGYNSKNAYSMHDNYGIYEKYYGRNSGGMGNGNDDYRRQVDLEMSYLASQGYSYDSIQAIMKRKSYGNQFNYQTFLQNSGMDAYGAGPNRSFGYRRDNRSGQNSRRKKKPEAKKEESESSGSEEAAQPPTAHYENEGDYTSGVALVHPQSSCIVKMPPGGEAKA